jgi:hypothetical protein
LNGNRKNSLRVKAKISAGAFKTSSTLIIKAFFLKFDFPPAFISFLKKNATIEKEGK